MATVMPLRHARVKAWVDRFVVTSEPYRPDQRGANRRNFQQNGSLSLLMSGTNVPKRVGARSVEACGEATPATMWRVVLAFFVTALVALAPMTVLLAMQGSIPSAGAIADSRYGEPALTAVLIVAILGTVAVATVVLVTTRLLRPSRG